MLPRASVPFPIVLVRFTGRGNVVGDLRPAGMLMGQGGGEGDAGARDLCPGGVRQGERRGDGDGGAAGGGRLSRSPYPETHPQRRTYAVYTPSIRSQLSNANLTFAGVRGRVSVF